MLPGRVISTEQLLSRRISIIDLTPQSVHPSRPHVLNFVLVAFKTGKKRKNKKKIKNRKIHLGIARPNDKESKK